MPEKYDFYAKSPSTREEIREYLTTWLEPTDTESQKPNGRSFIQMYDFRRAGYIHSVWRCLEDERFYWYVVPDNCFDLGFPTKSYASFDALIDGVVEEYYALWNR